jgi:HEAT repeat protein
MTSRRGTFNDKLDKIHALADLLPAQAAPELKRSLADSNGYLVGEAAKITAKLELKALAPDLAAAFMRLLAAPMEADKGCHGKKSLIEALLALDADAPEAFLAGLRYSQPEPAFGGTVDTASGLRGLCAHALVRMDHPAAELEVAPLLMDPEPDTRALAADALASTGEEICGAILHLKALAGDKEPDVLGACYRGMLALSPRRYLSFVGGALAGGEEIAAIALGESRLPEALPALKSALTTALGTAQDTVLLGVALLRLEEANAFLVELLEKAPEARAAAAIGALALHRHDEKLAARARTVLEARGSKRLLRTLEERFDK